MKQEGKHKVKFTWERGLSGCREPIPRVRIALGSDRVVEKEDLNQEGAGVKSEGERASSSRRRDHPLYSTEDALNLPSSGEAIVRSEENVAAVKAKVECEGKENAARMAASGK